MARKIIIRERTKEMHSQTKISFKAQFAFSLTPPQMGILLSAFESKLPEEKVRDITDHVFDHAIDDAKEKAKAEKSCLTFDEIHPAIVQVFQELNKKFPGASYNPPTKEKVEEMLKSFDISQHSEINREEFSKFVKKYTAELVHIDVNEVLIMSVTVPVAAIMVKWASILIAKVPTTIFVTAVTFALVLVYSISKK